MLKKFLTLFSFFLFTIASLAQRLDLETNNPNIIRNKTGFIITDVVSEGKQKLFKMVQYDKNLRPVDSLTQSTEKERYDFKEYSYGYEIRMLYNLLGRKGAFLKVDTNLKKISFEEYDQQSPAMKEVEDAYYKDQVQSNFYNYYGSFSKSIEIGDIMFRLYNSDSKKIAINGYKRKQATLFQPYSKLWEMELPNQQDVLNHCFFKDANERAYLYTSNLGNKKNKKRAEYLYCFNYTSGKSIYQVKLELKDTTVQTVLSDVLINKDDHSVFIAGGYYDKGQKERNATLTGYFAMLVDANGTIVKQKSIKLEQPVIAGLKENYFDRKALRFQQLTKNAKGNYQLIAENVALDPYIGSTRVMGQSGKDENQVTTGISFETYGFTFLEFDPELNLVNAAFQAAKKATEGSLLPGLSVFDGILDIVIKEENVYYNFAYCFSNSSQTKLIYSTPKKQYLEITRNGKELSVAP